MTTATSLKAKWGNARLPHSTPTIRHSTGTQSTYSVFTEKASTWKVWWITCFVVSSASVIFSWHNILESMLLKLRRSLSFLPWSPVKLGTGPLQHGVMMKDFLTMTFSLKTFKKSLNTQWESKNWAFSFYIWNKGSRLQLNMLWLSILLHFKLAEVKKHTVYRERLNPNKFIYLSIRLDNLLRNNACHVHIPCLKLFLKKTTPWLPAINVSPLWNSNNDRGRIYVSTVKRTIICWLLAILVPKCGIPNMQKSALVFFPSLTALKGWVAVCRPHLSCVWGPGIPNAQG